MINQIKSKLKLKPVMIHTYMLCILAILNTIKWQNMKHSEEDNIVSHVYIPAML